MSESTLVYYGRDIETLPAEELRDAIRHLCRMHSQERKLWKLEREILEGGIKAASGLVERAVT